MPIKGKQETTEVISTKLSWDTIIGTIPIIGSIMLYNWSKDSNVRNQKETMQSIFSIEICNDYSYYNYCSNVHISLADKI